MKEFKKLKEALERMNEFNAQMESEVMRLKELVKRTKNVALNMLGALKENKIHHGGNTTTKNYPTSIMRKGRLID